MENRKVDTDKLRSIAKDIDLLVNDCKIEINNVYNRINNMPSTTREWVGNTANDYARLVMLEKKGAMNTMDDVKKYSTTLKNIASEVDRIIAKAKEEEKNA